jgi:hypothetical protein
MATDRDRPPLPPGAEILDRLGFVPTGPLDQELAAARTPGELLELLADRAARALAAETAAGYRHFTILHGDLESDLDVLRMRRLGDLARSAGALLATRGGNDWTCYILRGRGADPTMLALEGACLSSGASWWRWSTDGTLPSMSDGTRHSKGPTS